LPCCGIRSATCVPRTALSPGIAKRPTKRQLPGEDLIAQSVDRLCKASRRQAHRPQWRAILVLQTFVYARCANLLRRNSGFAVTHKAMHQIAGLRWRFVIPSIQTELAQAICQTGRH
jgi:hypothetical protein